MLRLVAFLLGLVLLTPSVANAGVPVRFGKSEEIERLAPIALPGPSGERLYLGHKVTTQWFFGGIYLKDDGYVLGVEGQTKAYFALSAEKMALAQKFGLLPNPLPAYQIHPLQYLLGYSLWLFLVAVTAWAMIETAWKRSRAISQRAKARPTVL
uniref:Uncharacterized protein n=1 Tax=Caulobacter sp. (strain K31) TaxID=366602 RepID=B0T139_CAUSK